MSLRFDEIMNHQINATRVRKSIEKTKRTAFTVNITALFQACCARSQAILASRCRNGTRIGGLGGAAKAGPPLTVPLDGSHPIVPFGSWNLG
jgi:hypothetical protein